MEVPTLVRVHRADAVSDVFGLDFQPSHSRLEWTLRRIAAEGAGVLLYLRSDSASERIEESVRRAAVAKDGKSPTSSAPVAAFHDFGVGAQI